MGLMSLRRAMAGKSQRGRGGSERPPARPVGRRLAYALFLLAAAGAVLALYLTYVHHRLHREPGWESACAISDGLNCDAVILSPYGSVADVPLPILGAWFYLFVGGVIALELWGRARRFVRSPAVVALAASGVATAASAALAVVSIRSIGSLCLLCAGVYTVNIGLMILSWFAVRSTGESIAAGLTAERDHWARYSFRNAAGVVVVILVLLVMRAAYVTGTAGGSEICGGVAAALRPGPAEAVEVKIYSDFQCPHCKVLDDDLRRVRGGPGLRLVQLHYPIDAACNPRVKRTRHPGACLQALAALCAETQARGPEFSDQLFDEAPSTRDALGHLAGTLGLDREAFELCLGADGTAALLRRSIDEAVAAGVRATPTLFVNGRKHTGRLDADDLRCLQAASNRTGIDTTKGHPRTYDMR